MTTAPQENLELIELAEPLLTLLNIELQGIFKHCILQTIWYVFLFMFV